MGAPSDDSKVVNLKAAMFEGIAERPSIWLGCPDVAQLRQGRAAQHPVRERTLSVFQANFSR
jgi:hypothetical protein